MPRGVYKRSKKTTNARTVEKLNVRHKPSNDDVFTAVDELENENDRLRKELNDANKRLQNIYGATLELLNVVLNSREV